MKDAFEDRIEAEVVLRSAEPGASLQQAIQGESLNRVITRLRGFGFEITAHGSSSISIAGSRELFEKVFKMTSRDDALSVPEEISNQVEGVYVQSPPTYFDS